MSAAAHRPATCDARSRAGVLKYPPRTRPIIDDLIPNPFQLQLWIFIEDDLREIVYRDITRLQGAGERERRKPSIMLLPAQSLFLDGELDLVLVDDRHCAVMVIA